jgi:galactose mutarotase-like enzyme
MTLVLLVGQIVFGSSFIQAAVCPERGGELCSLQVLHKGKWVETLYSATTGWEGRAPWLWPATGKGAPLPFHGFVRDKQWQVVARSPESAAVGFSDTAATRAMYPYGFALRADYRAVGRKLAISFRVEAKAENTSEMPFAAGNHITFRTPLVEGTEAAAMTLVSPSKVEYLKADGAPTGAKLARSLGNGVLLRDFDARTAVSLGEYAGDPFMELRDPGGLTVRISQKASAVPAGPVVRFNMWGDPGKGYFSPEPWVGLQDAHRLGQGLVRLAPGKVWEWEIEISFPAGG